jgi:hypothetical protein
MAREISQAGEAVRQQDRAALHQARDNLQQAERELQGWIITARLAERQNWRLVQLAALGFIGGVVLGASLPTIVVQAAPERWAWPEKRAAHMLGRDMAAAGERLLAIADPQRWGEMQSAWAIVDDNRAVIARCRQTADKTGKPSRCAIVLTPAGAQTGLPSDPRLDQVPAVKRRLPASDGRSSTAGSPASWTAETCLVPQGKGSPSLVCAYRLPTRPPRLSFSIRDHDASNKDPSDPIRKATLGPLTDGRAFSTANRDLWTPSKLCSKENWL